MTSNSEILYINDSAFKIFKEMGNPKPSAKIIWVYFPKSKTNPESQDPKILNKEAIWLGLKLKALKDYPLNRHCPPIIKFKKCAAKVESEHKKYGYNKHKCFSGIDLTDREDYKIFLRHCSHKRINLEVPSNALIYPRCDKPSNLVNNTVYVDAVYGNDKTAELEDPAKPFQTIRAAIDAIPIIVWVKIEDPFFGPLAFGWNVQLAPGLYKEDVTVPAGVSLIADSPESTILQGTLSINGQGGNRIKSLLLRSSQVPAIKVDLNNEEGEENAAVFFQNVQTRIKPQESDAQEIHIYEFLQTSGINGRCNLSNCELNSDTSGFWEEPLEKVSVCFAANLELQTSVVSLNHVGHFNHEHKLYNINSGRGALNGGVTFFQITNERPQKDNFIYFVKDGNLSVNSVANTILETPIFGPPSFRKMILHATSNGLLNTFGLNYAVDSVPAENLILSQVSEFEDLHNIDATFSGNQVLTPPNRAINNGNLNSIKQSVTSSQGTNNKNGGVSSNFSKWSELYSGLEGELVPGLRTVLIDVLDANPTLPPIDVVNQTTNFTGTSFYIANVSGGTIDVNIGDPATQVVQLPNNMSITAIAGSDNKWLLWSSPIIPIL